MFHGTDQPCTLEEMLTLNFACGLNIVLFVEPQSAPFLFEQEKNC